MFAKSLRNLCCTIDKKEKKSIFFSLFFRALDRNEYNHITATYFLLAERRLRMQRSDQHAKQGQKGLAGLGLGPSSTVASGKGTLAMAEKLALSPTQTQGTYFRDLEILTASNCNSLRNIRNVGDKD